VNAHDRNRLDALVREVVESTEIPDCVEDLSRDDRHGLANLARHRGITEAEALAEARKAKESTGSGDEAAEIARQIRNRY
jgi:hypothetical protein